MCILTPISNKYLASLLVNISRKEKLPFHIICYKVFLTFNLDFLPHQNVLLFCPKCKEQFAITICMKDVANRGTIMLSIFSSILNITNSFNIIYILCFVNSYIPCHSFSEFLQLMHILITWQNRWFYKNTTLLTYIQSLSTPKSWLNVHSVQAVITLHFSLLLIPYPSLGIELWKAELGLVDLGLTFKVRCPLNSNFVFSCPYSITAWCLLYIWPIQPLFHYPSP